MGIFPYLTFTRLLRDGSREGLGRYAEALTSAIADWEGVDVASVKLRPSDPLQAWCPPVEAPGGGRRRGAGRTFLCRVPADDVVRKWWVTLADAGAPRITGALFADDPSEHLDEASDLRGYGDHLIRNAVADTADNLDEDVIGSGGHARGYRSGIFLVTKLEAFPDGLLSPFRVSETLPTTTLIRAVEATLCGGSPCREILAVADTRREVRRFLDRCDADLLERWGPEELSRLLALLGLTLKQWREVY